VLVELFGGLCAGLEMVLGTGLNITKYFYADTAEPARQLARHRLLSLGSQYPNQLPTTAYQDTLFLLPQDVRSITAANLEAAAAHCPTSRWLVVAGWPCEDMSPAGPGSGIDGPRSQAFFDAVRIMGTLQQLLPHPPAYLLENTFMRWGHSSSQVRDVDYPRILSILGPGVDADAARFGSGAYRLRTFWTNLQHQAHLHLAVQAWVRPPGLLVQPLLDAGHTLPPYHPRQQRPPHYPCNSDPQRVEALPTLVSYPHSNAYKGTRAGMLLDAASGRLLEPNSDERERLLGYATKTTAAPGLSESQRFRLTGQCMDANTLRGLFNLCLALDDVLPTLQPRAAASRALAAASSLPQLPHLSGKEWGRRWSHSPSLGWMHRLGWRPGQPLPRGRLISPLHPPFQRIKAAGLGFRNAPLSSAVSLACSSTAAPQPRGGVQGDCLSLPSPITLFDTYQQQEIYSQAVLAEERSLCMAVSTPEPPTADTHSDVWTDRDTLHRIQFGRDRGGLTAPEKKRVWKRARNFRMVEGVLQRRLPDNVWKVVPSPSQRTAIIMQAHRSTGHWGIQRTIYMVSLQHWWSNMREDVHRVLQACEECSRIKASFSAKPAELQPLEIQGLFARWSVDLAGPFPISKRGNRYVIVMIEGFSKQLEVEAIPEKTAAHTTYAFTRNVLCRYGACAEVVTDQGSEFQNEFHQMLRTAFIDHRTTSANHPSANGQAERMVQSLKRALEKYAAPGDGIAPDWDEYLPHIALGYRVSVQSSLGYSPYELLHGTKALLPTSLHDQFREPLVLENPEQAAAYLIKRAEVLRQHCAIAGGNLRIAQHRDKLRYQRMRSGYYNTVTTKFTPGGAVYVRRPNVPTNLQGAVRPGIYAIREVRDSGTIVVNGRCGTLAEVHTTNCAPCHLPNLDLTIDPTLRDVPESHTCHNCGSPAREESMLVCDGCLRGYHLHCLEPPLSDVPEESPWCCPDCHQQGITPAILDTLLRQDLRDRGLDQPVLRDQHEVMEKKAAAMEGQLVLLNVVQAGMADRHLTGTLRYLPPEQRKAVRRPLLLEVDGFEPAYMAVTKAQQATRTRLRVNLSPVMDPSLVLYTQMAFVAALDPSAPPQLDAFSEAYELRTPKGYCALYRDVYGTSEGCPTSGQPLQWVPELEWLLVPSPTVIEDPLLPDHMSLLFSSVDIQGCFRVADPVAQSPTLRAALQQRYQRDILVAPGKTSPPHPSNWLTPSYYRRLASKGPVDWTFLYPPISIADMALAIALSRSRIGVAMWIPRAYLSNLSAGRLRLLSALKTQRRLVVVQSWADPYLWVCGFATATHRTRMLCPCSAAVTAWTSL
jgi:Integrase zinc binding domain/Integrase core domain/PHD-finger/C-5 cytosine-specific DNA methylase